MIVNRAPDAAVVAEIFVEPSRIRVEWQGSEDLPVGFPPASARFTGEILKLDAARRAAEFRLPSRPAELLMAPAPGAAGRRTAFILYHLGLPTSDLHYLDRPHIVRLDWDDPGRSRFRDPRLRRQFEAPAGVFFYIEPFELRIEIIVRLIDLDPSLPLGLQPRATIPAAARARLLNRTASFLSRQFELEVDGLRLQPALDRAQFLRQRLLTSELVPAGEDVPAVSATVAVILSRPATGYPGAARLTWKLFNDRIPRLAASVTDLAASRPVMVTPGNSVLSWERLPGAAEFPALAALAAPPAAPAWLWLVAGLACTGLLILIAFRASAALCAGRPLPRRSVAAGFLLLLGAAWSFSRAASAGVDPAEARHIVRALLWNVYRAFDYKQEEASYDTLAQSVSGELLVQTYLEARRALELESQGGARASVKTLDLGALDIRPASRGFRAQCTWDVSASVGHWGHIHERRNRYEALLTIQPVAGAWKITALDLLSEHRR